MDNYKFERWAKKLGLPEEGKALIKKVREQPAVRSTTSKRGNVIGRFPRSLSEYSFAKSDSGRDRDPTRLQCSLFQTTLAL